MSKGHCDYFLVVAVASASSRRRRRVVEDSWTEIQLLLVPLSTLAVILRVEFEARAERGKHSSISIPAS